MEITINSDRVLRNMRKRINELQEELDELKGNKGEQKYLEHYQMECFKDYFRQETARELGFAPQCNDCKEYLDQFSKLQRSHMNNCPFCGSSNLKK